MELWNKAGIKILDTSTVSALVYRVNCLTDLTPAGCALQTGMITERATYQRDEGEIIIRYFTVDMIPGVFIGRPNCYT